MVRGAAVALFSRDGESPWTIDSPGNLDAAGCTIEGREENEPHLAQGCLVFAGVDYRKILPEVEGEGRMNPFCAILFK